MSIADFKRKCAEKIEALYRERQASIPAAPSKPARQGKALTPSKVSPRQGIDDLAWEGYFYAKSRAYPHYENLRKKEKKLYQEVISEIDADWFLTLIPQTNGKRLDEKEEQERARHFAGRLRVAGAETIIVAHERKNSEGQHYPHSHILVKGLPTLRQDRMRKKAIKMGFGDCLAVPAHQGAAFYTSKKIDHERPQGNEIGFYYQKVPREGRTTE